MPAVEMVGVSKTYQRRGKQPQKALDALDLVVDTGGVHGFLGPNGSGKTTTIRVLLGLVRPDSGFGAIRLLDQPVPDGLPEVIGSVGALVETPLFFPNFSGRLNLRLLAETAGVVRGPRRGVPGDRRSARPRGRSVQGLLARHEAAPGHRRRTAEAAAPAHPRRAEQRPGPGRHP